MKSSGTYNAKQLKLSKIVQGQSCHFTIYIKEGRRQKLKKRKNRKTKTKRRRRSKSKIKKIKN